MSKTLFERFIYVFSSEQRVMVKWRRLYYCLLLCSLLSGLVTSRRVDENVKFDQNYEVIWGYDHALSLDQGRQIQLSMDKHSGAGFASKLNFGSGFFNMKIKLPGNDSAGVVTAFYLTSSGEKRDELDFEFLGNREGKPIILQTNVFARGEGNREERVSLWFDPSADVHTYSILWNQHQIAFYVDEKPIRVFKNNTKIGVDYPTRPMKAVSSLWDGDSWATDGGQTKTNWSHSPFKAHFQGFDITACSLQPCNSPYNYWWNAQKYWRLDSSQKKAYENVRKKYVTYDYCSDKARFTTPPPECSQ